MDQKQTKCAVAYSLKGVLFHTQQFFFDEDINIFQAEVFSIGKACRFISETNIPARIYTDSHSAIESLTST